MRTPWAVGIAGVLATAMLAGAPRSASVTTPATMPATTPATTPANGHVAIDSRPGVQLFQWTWKAIAAECPTLADIGFGFVQTSPAQESITGPAWWTSYQPVSYRLDSKLGTADDLRAMIDTCHAAGVAVVVDAVINHMAAGDGVGFAGTRYQHYDYPGLWGPDDFHHCTLTGDGQIANYHDAAQVQTCELVGLADLDTSRPNVRLRLRQFLDELVGIGADGFRIDAAKHISVDDLRAITAGLIGHVALFPEVIRGGGEPIQPEQYTEFGRQYEFGYARALAPVFSLVMPERLVTITNGLLPSDEAISFVDNHDTERNGQTVDRRAVAAHRLAEIFLLADDYGLPMILSGYTFTNRDDGPPMDARGRVLDPVCGTAPWTCAHRAPHIRSMLAFRTAMGDAPATVTEVQRLAVVQRGDRGLVIVNPSTKDVTVTLTVPLPDGQYCDMLTADCDLATAGPTAVDVIGGSLTVTVPAADAVALSTPSA